MSVQKSSGAMASLFGWNSLAVSAPPKAVSIDHLFHNISQQKQEIVFAVDCSGSTCFNGTPAHDGKTFDKIYVEAVSELHKLLPPNHKVVCWSSTALELTGDQLEIYNNGIQNKVSFTTTLKGMNGGTDPQHVLPFAKNKVLVLLTDGDVQPAQIEQIKLKVPGSGVNSVFLVICPHIDSYKAMYMNNQNVEVSAKDSIRLSIPQSFSEKLATVIIWNYRKQVYELISELTAGWINQAKSLAEILNNTMPAIPAGQLLLKSGDQYKSFSLNDLTEFIKNNNIDETTITKLVDMGVGPAIRQQANTVEKDLWNHTITSLFNKIIAQKVKNDFKELPVPDGVTMLQRIQISVQNEKERNKIENVYRNELGKQFSLMLVNKVLAELTSVGAAKASQTVANVNAFKTMSVENKLAEIAPALGIGNCGICTTDTQVFRTVSIPAKLMIEMQLCRDDKIINGKKGKKQTVSMLNLETLKTALEMYPPRLHFVNLCAGCANVTMTQAKHHSDYIYGISNLIPQNQANGAVAERLIIFPFIASDKIDGCDPNEGKLSFARQWLRGFIADTIKLDPASDQTLTASLLFLSALSTNKENALSVYPNQVSLLRGGRTDRFSTTVGLLFKPTAQKISPETLNMISIVANTIDKAEIPIIPESNRLLLLCLLERNITILINAKNQRDTATSKLHVCLDDIRSKGDSSDKDKFGITSVLIETIQKSPDNQTYSQQNQELYNKYIATYLQNSMGVNLGSIAFYENSLMKVINATTIKAIAENLKLNDEYLQKMIERSKMSNIEFMEMIPKFVNDLVTNQHDKMTVMMKYI